VDGKAAIIGRCVYAHYFNTEVNDIVLQVV